MKKTTIMTAIERRMDWIYKSVICNEVNEGKDMTQWNDEIKELHDAYFELKEHSGRITFIQGLDNEVNNVVLIYSSTRD